MQATQLLQCISDVTGKSLAVEITPACDFALAIEGTAAVVGLRTSELRKCAPVAHPRYGNIQGALC